MGHPGLKSCIDKSTVLSRGSGREPTFRLLEAALPSSAHGPLSLPKCLQWPSSHQALTCLFFALLAPSSPFKDPCDHAGPAQIIRDSLPISRRAESRLNSISNLNSRLTVDQNIFTDFRDQDLGAFFCGEGGILHPTAKPPCCFSRQESPASTPRDFIPASPLRLTLGIKTQMAVPTSGHRIQEFLGKG